MAASRIPQTPKTKLRIVRFSLCSQATEFGAADSISNFRSNARRSDTQGSSRRAAVQIRVVAPSLSVDYWNRTLQSAKCPILAVSRRIFRTRNSRVNRQMGPNEIRVDPEDAVVCN